jgi:hypothetical protein
VGTLGFIDGFRMNSGTHPHEVVVGPGQVIDGKHSVTFQGGWLNLNAGIALAGRDDTPSEGGWAYIWLLQHKRRQGSSLVLSSNPVEPVLVSKCFRCICRWWLVGVWPIGMEGTLIERQFRFQHPQKLRLSSGSAVQLPVPGIEPRELVELMVVDRSGHGVSVFDGDLVEVPEKAVGQLHTPSNGIGGGPAVVAKGMVVAMEGRVVVVQDLAGSGNARADLYLCGVHL